MLCNSISVTIFGKCRKNPIFVSSGLQIFEEYTVYLHASCGLLPIYNRTFLVKQT